MTKILRKGAGNISPLRKPTIIDDQYSIHSKKASFQLHQGRSVTAEPNAVMIKRLNASVKMRDMNAIENLDNSQLNDEFELNPERKALFRKR